MKNIYFISDAHLGCRAIEHPRTHERRLVNFLDQIKDKAEAIYMLGDMFDFWFEYKEVVPKGFTRFLGKLSELTDNGVEIHYFTGNHDMWMGDYLEKECGVTIHRNACAIDLYGKIFYLAHGDGLDYRDRNWQTRFMFWCFHNSTLQKMAHWIHPHYFMNFGLNWAKHSRTKRKRRTPQTDEEGRILQKADSTTTQVSLATAMRKTTVKNHTKEKTRKVSCSMQKTTSRAILTSTSSSSATATSNLTCSSAATHASSFSENG